MIGRPAVKLIYLFTYTVYRMNVHTNTYFVLSTADSKHGIDKLFHTYDQRWFIKTRKSSLIVRSKVQYNIYDVAN